MPQQQMELHQLTQQHQDVKLIYQHAIGMEIQDVQVEDVQLILVFKLLALLSLQLESLVGHYQQLVLMLLA